MSANNKTSHFKKKLESGSCQNLLLIVKLIYFSNPFGIAFVLRLNMPSSCILHLMGIIIF